MADTIGPKDDVPPQTIQVERDEYAIVYLQKMLATSADQDSRSPSSSDKEVPEEKAGYAEEGHVEKINLNANTTAKYVARNVCT